MLSAEHHGGKKLRSGTYKLRTARCVRKAESGSEAGADSEGRKEQGGRRSRGPDERWPRAGDRDAERVELVGEAEMSAEWSLAQREKSSEHSV